MSLLLCICLALYASDSVGKHQCLELIAGGSAEKSCGTGGQGHSQEVGAGHCRSAQGVTILVTLICVFLSALATPPQRPIRGSLGLKHATASLMVCTRLLTFT